MLLACVYYSDVRTRHYLSMYITVYNNNINKPHEKRKKKRKTLFDRSNNKSDFA